MLDHVTLIREFFVPFVDLALGMAGLEDCESLFTHLKNRKTIAEKFLVRHFSAIQQTLEMKELDNV